ncbi:hypothetical protein FOZ60_005799 [Perkinsus olseni]|uniref:Uncharacterized protein n=1 Tax=Perkinsus olseni TaxID=32597 RepID=A0A7J6PI60_PEROL|nr:hypothetical protein FOZ60_005799 [Perkinsus olseni]
MSSSNSTRRVSKSISTSRLSNASSSSVAARSCKPRSSGRSTRKTRSSSSSKSLSSDDDGWEWYEDTADGPGYYPLSRSRSTGFLPQIGRGQNPGGLGDRSGADIPGYGGYIPGKYSDNVFGQVFANANRVAQAIKLQQAMDRDEAHQGRMDEWQKEGGKIMRAWKDSQHGRYHHIKGVAQQGHMDS